MKASKQVHNMGATKHSGMHLVSNSMFLKRVWFLIFTFAKKFLKLVCRMLQTRIGTALETSFLSETTPYYSFSPIN
jgi:hypothetical protein